MAEILVSIAAKVTEYLVEPTIQQGQYLFCVRRIIKNLEDEKKKLTLTKENVQNRVEEAKKKTEKIENEVENWMNQVTNLLAEVENLQQEMNENNSCCQGWNRSCRRYNLCREMAKKTKIMINLNNNSKFELFSRLATLPGIEYFNSRNFIYFESTKSAYNQLLEAIQDDDSYMVGLYGMGGCGKTTLVKEVGKKTKEFNLFDRVVLTTVTQTPNIRRMQGEIADLLGLKLDEETEMGRARRISLKFRSGERILVILDDVWARLNLEDIGIPFNESHGACKVLLTTRRQQVCTLMECQRKVLLGLLSDEEAWDLLQKHARIDDVSFSSLLNELAWGVVRECKGLPLAIEVVGTSLREKSIDEWKIAVCRLKHSKPIDIEEGVRDVFACMRLSYDHLGSELAKSLLLMCSLFPEDHEILIEDLFRYGIGTSLCGEVESFDVARSEVNVSIKKLIDSCLLMHPQKGVRGFLRHDERYEERTDRVKMHDVVRDVALWIASQEGHAIMVDPVRDLKAKATDCFALSFWNEEIPQFPNPINAPMLQILLLNKRGSSFKLSNGFFECMEGLKVMSISREYDFPHVPSLLPSTHLFLPLPQSTHLLTNLRILRLVNWHLGDVSFVVSLRVLEILDLSGSFFKELPNGIENLSRLMLLDLSWCDIEEDSCQVIARCSQLEELHASGSNLCCRSRSINSYECSLDDAAFPKLHRYSLDIGWDYPVRSRYRCSDSSKSRTLQIVDFNASTSGATIKELLQRSEIAFLFHLMGGSDNLIPELVQAIGGLNDLRHLYLDECSEIECLINTTSDQVDSIREDVVLPRLVGLMLQGMDNMKEVCHGPPPLGFFDKLKEITLSRCNVLQSTFPRECKLSSLNMLNIYTCGMLISLFPISVAQTLILLQHLTIYSCHKMKQIVANEGENGTDTGDKISLVPNNSRFMFPKLRTMFVGSCNKLECIFPISCVKGLLQLERLYIGKCSELKYVFGQYEHNVHSSSQYNMHIGLPLLKQLILEDLPNILSIFPDNYELRLPSSTRVLVRGCPKLTLSDDINAIYN